MNDSCHVIVLYEVKAIEFKVFKATGNRFKNKCSTKLCSKLLKSIIYLGYKESINDYDGEQANTTLLLIKIGELWYLNDNAQARFFEYSIWFYLPLGFGIH